MRVSIIVPVYNQLPFVLKLCRSLAQHVTMERLQEGRAEVILVDDCSTELNLPELLGPPLRVIRNESNKGFVATENIGAKAATGDLLLFLNSDIELLSDIGPMVGVLIDNLQVGVVGPKLVFPPNETGEATVQSCGGWYDAGRGPFHRYLGWLASDPRVNRIEKVSWMTGAALMTPKALFDSLGGFDERYGRGYFDDTDYCERVKASGREIWYQPEVVMMHHVGKSMGAAAKTEVEMRVANKSFRANSNLFHERWNERIEPDVQYLAVDY